MNVPLGAENIPAGERDFLLLPGLYGSWRLLAPSLRPWGHRLLGVRTRAKAGSAAAALHGVVLAIADDFLASTSKGFSMFSPFPGRC